MREFLRIATALSDGHRVRAVMFLGRGELCLCQVVRILRVAPSTASRHMTILRQAGLVEARKEGRWTYYRLPGRKAPAQVRQVLRWLQESLRGDRQVEQDVRRLEVVRRMRKERLCACYRR